MIKNIEKKWIANFKKSPLVDKENGAFKSTYAYQLFYGKNDDMYPSDFPHNFLHFFNTCDKMDRESAVENLNEFLAFLGIKIRNEAILNHLEKFPNDFNKLIKKVITFLKPLLIMEVI